MPEIKLSPQELTAIGKARQELIQNDDFVSATLETDSGDAIAVRRTDGKISTMFRFKLTSPNLEELSPTKPQ